MNTARLADVADINPRGEKVNADDLVSFVGMAELDSTRAEAVPNSSRSFAEVSKGYTVFRDGDVLAAKITPCWENGKIGIARLDHELGVGSTEFHVLRPRAEIQDRFLLHFLRQPHLRAAGELRMTGSGGQRRIPVGFLQELAVPLPPLPEQRRIAAILDHADALRARRRQVLAHLNVLTQSMLHQLLHQGFERVTLGELIAQGPKNGLYRPSSDYGSGTPIVRIDSFKFGSRVISMECLKRLRASDDQVKEFALAAGDLLVNRVNSREHVGKTALVGELNEPTVFESNMMRIRVDRKRLLPVFAAEFMQTKDVRAQVAPMTKDAVNQSSINQSDVRNIHMPLPPLAVQSTFADRVDAITKLRAAELDAIAMEDELFASLQSRAFRGEL